MRAGKAARTHTPIANESASIATAAIDLAKQQFGTLQGRNVLIVGAGKMGGTAAKRLRTEGVKRLVVTSRSIAHAQDVIRALGFGQAIELPELPDALACADVVITSTGASEFVLTRQMIACTMERRARKPLSIIDLAVPRDVDPDVAALTGVTLIDVDGLKTHVEEKLHVRREAIPAVEQIVQHYVERFRQWYDSRVAVPAIASLTKKAEDIRAAEIERLFARCPALRERERMLITGMSLTIISKLLHTVVTKMRDKAVTDHLEALQQVRVLEELFELDIAGLSAGSTKTAEPRGIEAAQLSLLSG
jgi:glutamyl-tRNA reductase